MFTGHFCLKLQVKHAVKAGADAIATVPPLFFKPKTIGKGSLKINWCFLDACVLLVLWVLFLLYRMRMLIAHCHFFKFMGINFGLKKV